MAVDFCTENLNWAASPRISFSCDLAQFDGSIGIPVDRYRPDSSLLDPSPDFDFCVCRRSEQDSPSADELFSDGKILPLQFKSSVAAAACPEQPHLAKPQPEASRMPPSPRQERQRESLREIVTGADGSEKRDPAEKPATSGSRLFWPFRRSSSLNSGNGQKSSSIWSLQLLSRSNSTGSADPSRKHPHSRDTHKNPNPKASPPSSSPSSQKPPLKKNGPAGRTTPFGSYGNGTRISPVLNVPPPYISKGTTNLFGFGYFFSTRRDKKMKKKPFSREKPTFSKLT